MDTFEYIFTSKAGDRYIVKIQQDGIRFLSSQAIGYTVQYYRNKLFSNLFLKFQGLLDTHVVDIPICIDACGNEMYIHLIAREEHETTAELIKQDVLDGFSK